MSTTFTTPRAAILTDSKSHQVTAFAAGERLPGADRPNDLHDAPQHLNHALASLQATFADASIPLANATPASTAERHPRSLEQPQ
ncbi:hypothetical protein FS837_010840 [Tulasnella sp. UAMH 9824]|nr:hypothetical protein FS837_010840 [Tulasnella sp. UAMH 9824]